MKTLKRTISLLLCVALMATMIAVIAAAQATAADTQTAVTSAKKASDFSWDNASVYFLLTDRFYNGNTANDHSYNRLKDANGNIVTNLNSNITTFHGGDFAGITKKIKEGYFDDLGVNAIWMSAPYEQIHGYVCVNGNDKKTFMPHFAYHGYYALDYTETDLNFGTAEEFKTMVNTAHEHGIRVVLDIVMNHPGYNTLYDMLTLGYGGFKSNFTEADSWKNHYSYKSGTNYHSTIDYASAAGTNGWAKWWGADWLRAGLSGYTPVGNDSLTGSAGGDLPDFKTESSATVQVPTFLQNKWKSEGTYNNKMNQMNSWFTSTGNSKTVRNYLVCWLSQWVKDYGIDGFRCDTAKHVELASWKALSDECTKSLNQWRSANKGKYEAANWTDDFWMTAEDYGSGVNKDSYYTSGGFDSKINFSFSGGGGVSNSGSIMNVYNDYANKINNDSSFNVLTYISSHDTQLCRGDLIYQGSAFQLLPGAIQIFYGDETARPADTCSFANAKDHNIRSDMNWNSINTGVLTHWQKVGKFRSNHIAVGAGTNKAITATSGVAFVRQYDKNGIEDTVFACIDASKNANVTLTVGSYVDDGTTLTNAYDGKTATVSGGKVTFNSGANGTILVEVPTAPEGPDVTVTPAGGEFKTDSVTITATLNEIAKSGTYKIGNASPVTFTGTKTFTVGADLDFNQSVTVAFTATDGTTTKNRSYTYTKVDPNATPFKFPTATTTYLVDTANWGEAYCYAWVKGTTTGNSAWPGVKMEAVGEYNGSTVYSYDVTSKYNMVIFNNNNGTQTDDTDYKSYAYYDNSKKDWVSVDPPVNPTTAKPTVKPTDKPTQPATVAPTTPIVGPVNGVLGDADLDGVITITDATTIQRILAKLATATAKQKFLADVNGNGELDITDATYIQRYLAKLPIQYEVGKKIIAETQAPTSAPVTQAPVTQAPVTQAPVTQAPQPTTPVISTKNTIYVDMGTQCDAYAYYWADKNTPLNWPGIAMTHVSGSTYSIEVDKEFTKIVFSVNGSNQTSDIDIPGDNRIYVRSTGSWQPYNGPIVTPTPTTSDNIDFSDASSVYICDDGNWGDVYIHLWNIGNITEWPGQKLSPIGQYQGHNLYKYTINVDYKGFVIDAGVGKAQSENLTLPGANKVFMTSSKNFVNAN